MKNFLRNFVVFAAVLLVGAFTTSCDKQEENYESGSIYGTWEQYNDAGTHIVVKFNNDTTGSLSFTYSNGDSSVENFTYDYHKDNRVLKVLEASCLLWGDYEVSVSAKRIELNGYNYHEGDYVWYSFTRI